MLKRSFLSLFLLLVNISPSSQRNEPYALRISCGARENVRTPPTNTLWYKDFAYSGGRPANASHTSFIEPHLKTLRYFPLSDGPENCYIINNVPNGHYSVRIFFALVSDLNSDNEPLFDVSVEGTQIYSLESGWSNVDEQSFVEALVFVTDRSVSFCFHSTGHGDPSILSIEILQVDDNEYNFGLQWGKGTILRTAKRVCCGCGKPAFGEDYISNHWSGDRFWAPVTAFSQGSDQSLSVETRVKGINVPPNFYPEKLYQSAIVSTDIQPDLSFDMEVEPNKNYSIWLHFAEIDQGITKKGQRIFDILINGDIAFKDVDIIGATGEPYSALVLNKTVAVKGRTLTITMHPTRGNHAIVSAIEVFEIIAMESKTSPGEVRALQTLKNALGLPLRFGWNGDPCVPQQHPWNGVDCQFNKNGGGSWVIDGLGLDNQGLRGTLPDDISKLTHLQSINLSGNSIRGSIPATLGTIVGLETLDLSYNLLNGTIPEGLGQLKLLKRLDLNGNSLSGEVPSALGGRLLHRASFNFTDNAGLCGIPGLRPCGPHLSTASKIAIAFGVLVVILLIIVISVCWWKRRQNILRAQKLAARDAPYAKARTHFVREVQLGRPQVQEHPRTAAENGSRLLT
ncbi:receptor-like protein 4 [Aristolochia californica]|uniref:receptor-like protein 4 n=1 Tax=Aristolochia californica TaxID=171875 RepID=UPI0035E20696